MRDFTLSQYAAFLDALRAYGFHTLTLRHDVDFKPQNSLRTARCGDRRGRHRFRRQHRQQGYPAFYCGPGQSRQDRRGHRGDGLA